MPKSVSDPLVICTGCPGNNRHGEANTGLPIEPYGSPVAGYVGRFMESTNTGDYQQPFRTARAGRIRVAPQQRGSAPPRVYSQIGSALGVFSLSNYYTEKLAASTNALGDVHNIIPYLGSLGRSSERVARPDAIVYAEASGSGWMTSWEDGQQRLFDFDFDDRGYVYLAYEHFGWGMVQDDGRGSGAMLPLVSQQFKDSINILPTSIISLKSGQQYYAVVSQAGMDRYALYNVTQPGSHGAVIRNREATIRTGPQWGIRAWAKDEGQQRIAYVTSSYTVRVMSYANFISGGAPIAEFYPSSGRGIFDVSFDEQGDIWMAERSTTNLTQIETNVLRKATPSGSSSYTEQTYNVYGSGRFSPTVIHAAAGYVVVAGRGERESGIAIETRILKVSGGVPALLDDGNYFRRVYGFSRRGYAMPAGHTGIPTGVLLHRYNNKTYFLYSLDGIGDVYELSGEPPPPCTSYSISPTSVNPLSTAGSQSVNVIGAPAGCSGGAGWSAAPNVNWLSVSPSSGAGSGSTTVSWTTHTGTSTRNGTATIAGSTFTVNQKDISDSSCTSFSISPTSASPNTNSGSQQVSIAGLPAGCIGGSWNATSNASWITLSASSGSGPTANVTASWTSNTGTSSRSGTATIAGNTYTVNQQGPSSCGPLPPASLVDFSATCTTGCPVGQTITFYPALFGYAIQPCDTVSWNFGDGTSGTGSNGVGHAYSAGGTYSVTMRISNSTNPNGVSNTRNVVVGSGVATCSSFNVAPSTLSAGQSSGSSTVSVTGSPSGCSGGSWSTVPNANWLSVSPASGTGSGNVTVSWSAYSGEQTRSGTVAIANRSVTVNQAGSSSPCGPLPPVGSIAINATCTTCQIGQEIIFFASVFGQSLQSCDVVTWNFGDGSPTANGVDTSHIYSNSGDFVVTMTVSNSNGNVSTTRTISVPGSVPVKPLPVLTFSSAPTKASKGVAVSFTVESTNLDNATGWSWDFGDGTIDNSQAGVTAKSNTRTHTFATAGPYTVTVKARNGEDVPTAQSTLISRLITIEDIAEFRYLLPAVIHMTGANESLWRTDVQIYNPDPNVTTNPLKMTASFKEITKELEVVPATFIYEDFLAKLLIDRPADQRQEQGPVIITVRGNYPPQIWTRTYNQTPEGTFGQFIPAIRLDEGGGGSFGEGLYFLAGLRQNTRYRTNIGLVNPNPAAITATLRVFDDSGTLIGDPFERQLNPFQLDQFSIAQIDQVKGKINANRPFSIEINVPTGLWVVAYASFIDGGSNDPVFLQAVRQSELASGDYRNLVVPGVGHIGAWRSDVTIFNPSTTNFTVVDLTYRDGSGAKVGEAKTLLINKGEFLQYDGLLKQGIFGSLPDSLGMLHIDVAENVSGPFPMAFARTYNDDGSGKTFGQGIGGFASARANVKPGKPGLIPSVRSDESYYTNVGLTNLTGAAAKVRVSLLDQVTGAAAGFQEFDLAPYQSIIRSRTDGKDLIEFLSNGTATRSTLKIEVLSGGNVWAYASVIDRKTNDPEYVPATVQQ
ncbi:MAG TPA: PKD domain-containing protein [Thermoanaerobaculia bacterium]